MDALELDGYTFDRRVRSTQRSGVWLGRREADGVAVMAKRYVGRPDRARREMELLQQFHSPLLLEPLALESSNEGPVLVTKLFPGQPVTTLFAERPFAAEVFLPLARQIAEALAVVHEGRLIHKDLSPGNILVDLERGRACLIDFGLAQRFGQTLVPGQMSSTEGGTLLYMSPEQTGRMDRGVDFRSDLYSLGAVFYEVVAGRPPFEFDDTLSLVHAHFAKPPACPTEHDPTIPKTIARIILKLLEKEPDRRYQTAGALAADLAQCESELAAHGALPDDLQLAAADVPDRPVFGTTLYGCDEGHATMRAAFDRAAAGGFELCIVRGPAGTGKTALVDALRAAVSEARGVVALGAFQAQGSEQPCLGWIGALSSLAQQLLVESDKEFRAHRARIEGRLGELTPVVTDFVSELEFVLGEHPPPPVVDADQTLNRLCRAVVRLLSGYCAPDAPLVLVLEDIQWMDPASGALLQYVVESGEIEGCLLIATVREDRPGGPPAGFERLGWLEDVVAEASDRSHVVHTGPLSQAETEAMLCEALQTTADRAAALVGHVSAKTGNVPLLVKQFISWMVDQGAIRYRHPGGWTWDESAIAAADIADDAVELMRRKIDGLDAGLQRMLKCASVIGREFDAPTLAALSGDPLGDVEAASFALNGSGVISVCAAGFRFAHDRIREAAHAALAPEERVRLHRKLGRMLLEAAPLEQLGARIFAVADHVNQGDPQGEEERAECLDLNMRAARQALHNGAAESAVSYVEHARTALAADAFERDPARALELCLLGCEATVFAGDFERALAWLEPLSNWDADPITLAKIAAWRLRVFAVTRPPIETVRHMLEVARRFGVRWPLHPSRWRVILAQMRTEWILRDRASEDLFRPPGPNPAIPVLLLTGPAGGPMTRTDARLSSLASCLAVGSYAKYGVIARPAFSLAAYASFLLLYSPFPGRAARYLPMIHDWNSRAVAPPYNTRAEVILHISVAPWLDWRRKAVDPLAGLSSASREAGDFEHVAYSLFLRGLIRALVGEPMASVCDDLAAAGAAVRKGQLYAEPFACLRAYEHLAAAAPPDLDAGVRASVAFADEHPAMSQGYAATVWMMVACILGRPDLACAQSDRVFADLLLVSPYIHIPDHVFYRGLAAAQRLASVRGRERRQMRKRLASSVRWLGKRADLGPDFQHMALFLAAERERLRGRAARARALYRQASERAQHANYPHHLALVFERWASFERQERRPSQALDLRRRAAAKYEAWGAVGKAASLVAE